MKTNLLLLPGVARQYTAHSGKENSGYWAGVWVPDLPCGLPWRTQDEQSYRPDGYRAPTWSWASIQGHTGYRSSGKAMKYFITMEVADIKHVSSDKFNAVASAILPVQSRLIPVRYAEEEDGKYCLVHRGEEIENIAWYPDEKPSELSGGLLCLTLFTGLEGMYGLAVARQDEDSEEYRRTGVFSIRPEKGKSNDEDWIYPYNPFAELWDMEPEDEEWVYLV